MSAWAHAIDLAGLFRDVSVRNSFPAPTRSAKPSSPGHSAAAPDARSSGRRAVGLIARLVPGRHATRIDPAIALRTD